MKKGFTPAELLVVIAIIAILGCVVASGTAVGGLKASTCLDDLKQTSPSVILQLNGRAVSCRETNSIPGAWHIVPVAAAN